MVYKLGPEPEMVHTLTLDVSPAVLIPFYDEDSGTLFLSSKVRNSQWHQKYSEACQWCHSRRKPPGSWGTIVNEWGFLGFSCGRAGKNMSKDYVKIWNLCQITLETNLVTLFYSVKRKNIFHQKRLIKHMHGIKAFLKTHLKPYTFLISRNVIFQIFGFERFRISKKKNIWWNHNDIKIQIRIRFGLIV